MIKIKEPLPCQGRKVHSFTLTNERGMEVTILSLGAIIQKLIVPDRKGNYIDVCLGFDNPEDYLACEYYMGGCIGRCAGRISGASFSLENKTFALSQNDGPNCLHGGAEGFHRRIWDFYIDNDTLILSRTSPHLEEGFPGNVDAKVAYRLDDDNRLFIDFSAACDQDTPVSFSNHTYFNLAGKGDVLGHRLKLWADAYTPCSCNNIPTGEIAGVSNTPLDFTCEKLIGQDLHNDFLAPFKGYDHNFVLSGEKKCKKAARLESPDGNISMELYTTAPAMQFYTGNFLGPAPGKNGAHYAPYFGLCLEPQQFPNAVNEKTFPCPVLKAGKKYEERIIFDFLSPDGM